VATYTQKPGVYHAAYWNGEDSGPIDTMMTGLYGDDYVGSTPDGTDLIVNGQNNLLFQGGGYSFRVAAESMLVRGPVYGDFQGEARWQAVTPGVFTDQFNLQSE